MGIFDRLEAVLKSYLNDGENCGFERRSAGRPFGDPDMEAAFEELDEFLNSRKSGAFFEDSEADQKGAHRRTAGDTRQVLGNLKADFAELGLPFEASAEECKAAYKRLLKKHHPDRHAGHAENMKKATEKSARINAAYDRIERWRKTGQSD
ncbi:MAG: J domain-containing protein [Treponema sp.]|nr:J domain-containing protein [Treponema sp.]